MGITYEDLSGADFARLETVGESWMKLYQVLEEQAAELISIKDKDDAAFGIDNWDGQSGEAARERIRELVLALDERSAAARRVSLAITVAIEEFKAAQSELNDIIAEVDPERATLTGTGSLIPNTAKGTENIYYAEGLSTRITAALDRATAADDDLKAAIGTWAETFTEAERLAMINQAGDEAEELQELIDSGATPEQINDWWNDLSESERLGILEGNPALIASVDGIPTDTRDAANRDLLEAQIDRYSPTLDQDTKDAEDRIAELEGNWSDIVANGDPIAAAEELDHLRSLLPGLEDQRDERDDLIGLQDAITGNAPTGQEYFLLGYDSADDGKAIVSVGNPDTADNTAIYVPGTGGGMDGATGSDLKRAETMAEDAADIPGSGETAVVVWMDYDAPNNPLLDSPSTSYAEDASAPLASFMSGLDTTNHDPEGTTTTIMGHSYGTTVIGQAASEHGLATDQIVAVASPGMTVDHASELGTDPDNFYATTAPGDAINAAAEATGILGPDPNDSGLNLKGLWLDTGFGGTSFESSDMGWDPVDIHGNYWDEGNPARNNMALIFTGNGDQVS